MKNENSKQRNDHGFNNNNSKHDGKARRINLVVNRVKRATAKDTTLTSFRPSPISNRIIYLQLQCAEEELFRSSENPLDPRTGVGTAHTQLRVTRPRRSNSINITGTDTEDTYLPMMATVVFTNS
ncbi:hypothetical protein QTP88_002513 [Uroleucon formosanum]